MGLDLMADRFSAKAETTAAALNQMPYIVTGCAQGRRHVRAARAALRRPPGLRGGRGGRCGAAGRWRGRGGVALPARTRGDGRAARRSGMGAG